jgi:hypothetical protein
VTERVEWGIRIPNSKGMVSREVLHDPLRFTEDYVRETVATDNSLGGECRVVRRVVTETEWEEPADDLP